MKKNISQENWNFLIRVKPEKALGIFFNKLPVLEVASEDMTKNATSVILNVC